MQNIISISAVVVSGCILIFGNLLIKRIENRNALINKVLFDFRIKAYISLFMIIFRTDVKIMNLSPDDPKKAREFFETIEDESEKIVASFEENAIFINEEFWNDIFDYNSFLMDHFRRFKGGTFRFNKTEISRFKKLSQKKMINIGGHCQKYTGLYKFNKKIDRII